MNILLYLIAKLLICLASFRNKRIFIDKFGGISNKLDPFLIRSIIFRNKKFNYFIHEHIRTDAMPHHDHPWDFISLVIKGTFLEEIRSPETGKITTIKHSTNENRIYIRKSNEFHRIIIPTGERPITMIICFNKKHKWNYLLDTLDVVSWKNI